MNRFLIPLLFFVTTALLAQAPETILPGDARVDGSIIRAAKQAWRMTATSPGGHRTDGGVWSDTIEILTRDGRSIIRRTQVDRGPEGTTTFVTETDRDKLTPIRAEVTNGAGFHQVWAFAVDHIHAVVTAPAKDGQTPKTKESDVAIDQPVFDFDGGLFGLLVAGFPLQRDFSARFPVFDPRHGVAWANYTVIGRERVPAGKGRKLHAWIVEVQDPVRVARIVFALTKEPPYVVRLQEVGEGKFWTFDLL
ncbi:MAG TPA: hypothetical protein VN605_13895 [Thermoanaerobaculia bacterium]|nr:hypothetical protein [Thermoanaerobaculia bacterium]